MSHCLSDIACRMRLSRIASSQIPRDDAPWPKADQGWTLSRVRKKVEAFPQACSPASLWGFPRLRDLQQMAIRVVEEGPDLVTPLDGRGDEHGSAGAQHLVGSRAVRHPHG